MTDIFSDILGHEHAREGLIHAIKNDRLHHALLFSGPSGIGKSMIARSMIQAMLCENSTREQLQKCMKCRNCHRIASNIHPDVIEIDEPTATIKIETIRDLQKKLIYFFYEAARRFVIIQDVHKMQDAAANCLLKTLEEPEPHTTFILITSQIQRLLPTIVSRCQLVRFAPFSMDEISQFLVRRGMTEDDADQISALSGGSIGTALELSSSEYEKEVTSTFEEMLSPSSSLDAFLTASGLKGKKSMAEHLLTLMLMFVRDMLVLKTDPNHPIILKHYRPQMMSRLSRTTEKDLQRAAGIIQEVHESFQGNVNELVAWERLMIGLHGVIF